MKNQDFTFKIYQLYFFHHFINIILHKVRKKVIANESDFVYIHVSEDADYKNHCLKRMQYMCIAIYDCT